MPIRYVQSKIQRITAASSIAVQWPDNTLTGNHIVVAINAYASVSISSIVDSQSNTYQAADSAATTNLNTFVYQAHNVTGGTTPTVTVTFSGSTAAEVNIREYSGLKTSSAHIKGATLGDFGAKTGTSTTPNTYELDLRKLPATENTQALLIATGAILAQPQVWSVGDSFLHLDQIDNTTNPTSFAVADRVVDLTQDNVSYSTTFNVGTSAAWISTLNAFSDFSSTVTPETVTAEQTTYWS